MNYIKKLEIENLTLKGQLRDIQDNLQEFLAHLNSPKFQGAESDGSRKDWIATADVIERVRALRQLTLITP